MLFTNIVKKKTKRLKSFLSKIFKNNFFSFLIVIAIALLIPLTLSQVLYNTNILNFASGGSYYISGTVFVDINKNGVWDKNEQPAKSVNRSISLISGSGKTVQTTNVTANGGYGFYNIPTGKYSVRPSFSTSTKSLNGITIPPSNMRINIGISAGTANNGVSYISGTVFVDINKNGVWDNGEKAAVSINKSVSLVNGSGKTVQTTNVTANGGYGFYNIPTGTYSVKPSFSVSNSSSLNNIHPSNSRVNIGYTP